MLDTQNSLKKSTVLGVFYAWTMLDARAQNIMTMC